MPDTTAPRWRWLPGAARYYDFTTHRYVSAAKVRAWGWEAIGASRDRATAAAEMVADGRLTTADWQTWMRAEIKREYIRQYILGKGGLSTMNNKDWSSIGGMLREQYKYLDKFAAEVAAGGLAQGEIAARSRMYLNSSTESFWRATERATGMPPLPCYPGDGSSLCLTNDRCYWDIKPIGKAGSVTGWRCFWKLTPADHCTSDALVKGRAGEMIPHGCLQRAALWNPLTLWLPGHEPGAARKALADGAKYSADQPRVPAGQATGGQFTTHGAAFVTPGATATFKSERMVHELYNVGGVRWQITSRLKPEFENWLDQANADKDAVYLTIELPVPERNYAYLNRVDALKSRRGLARETLCSALGLLRQRGVAEARGYIERGNDASEHMLTRLGGHIFEHKEQGSIWQIDLAQKRKALAADDKGGAGSGFFGHAGRSGLVGGSAPATSAPAPTIANSPTAFLVKLELEDAQLPDSHTDGLGEIGFTENAYIGYRRGDGSIGEAYGDYDPRTHKIRLACNAPNGGNIGVYGGKTILHEVGHHVACAKMSDEAAARWAAYSQNGQTARISAYARTCRGEHFAEVYRAYASGADKRRALKTLEPLAYKFVQRLFRMNSPDLLPDGVFANPNTWQTRYTD